MVNTLLTRIVLTSKNDRYPTYLDAVAFAYFHIILAIPQITDSNADKEAKRHASELRNLVLNHSNLVKYTKKMYSTWLK